MFDSYFTQTLKENEHLVEVLHRHWASFALTVAELTGLALLPLFGISFLLASRVALLVYVIFLGLLLLFGTYRWVVWYFDVFIITDLRIIDIEQLGLFRRKVSEASMSRIQDVTYSVDGFFATLWDYGTVTVRTASESALQLKNVPDPEGVQEVIVELQKLAQSESSMSASELVSYIASLRGEPDASEPLGHEQPEEASKPRKKRQV